MGTVNNSKPLSFEDMEDETVVSTPATEVVAEVVADIVSATADVEEVKE